MGLRYRFAMMTGVRGQTEGCSAGDGVPPGDRQKLRRSAGRVPPGARYRHFCAVRLVRQQDHRARGTRKPYEAAPHRVRPRLRDFQSTQRLSAPRATTRRKNTSGGSFSEHPKPWPSAR